MIDERDSTGRAAVRWWRIAALLLAAYAVFTCAEFALWDAHRLPGTGTIGVEQLDMAIDPAGPAGTVRVAAVAAGSPFAAAGVRVGDRLHFRPAYDYLRYRQAGETVHAVVERDGRAMPVSVTAAPRTGAPDWDGVRFYLGNLVPALFGGLIVWRSRRGVAGLLLGTAMVVFGPPSPSAMMWEGASPAGFLFFATLNRVCIVAVGFFLLAFAMRFVAESVGGVGRRQWQALKLYGVGCIPVLAVWTWCDLTATSLPAIGNGSGLVAAIGYVGFAASLFYLALGWLRTAKAERNRFALFFAGVAAFVVAQTISFVVFVNLSAMYSASHPLLAVAELLSGVVAPGLLTHAILRHRVLDIGFILNRTLVYGAVSAVLLVAFGLIERGVDELVTIEGREQNALVDAGIALGVYLVFHRFRHTAEHWTESFFFREWHHKEAALRRAIEHAGFINSTDALRASAQMALGRFCDGAAVTVYRHSKGGHFIEADGVVVDGDHPAVVEMRAEARPVRLEGRGPDAAELGLPMAHRRELIGFILIGAKPGATDYRPDEVDLLGWAAHQIGQDFHTLEMDRLETMVRVQAEHITVLQARYDERVGAGPAARPA
ncbi:hypothetical protein [Sphingomonas sp.]|uniref:hypothetical protein n=1 Tax=Sphingomonas sp. TaxID=28214 RepID=UPI003CC5F58D